MSVIKRNGNVPHTKWINLKGGDVLVECAILKEDDFGNMHFVEIPSLDDVDKRRLVKILTDRNANNFELWDLMGQKTLNNGMNALEYFHQLVKVITPAGKVMNPRDGHIGVGKIAVGEANEAAEAAEAAK